MPVVIPVLTVFDLILVAVSVTRIGFGLVSIPPVSVSPVIIPLLGRNKAGDFLGGGPGGRVPVLSVFMVGPVVIRTGLGFRRGGVADRGQVVHGQWGFFRRGRFFGFLAGAAEGPPPASAFRAGEHRRFGCVVFLPCRALGKGGFGQRCGRCFRIGTVRSPIPIAFRKIPVLIIS